MVGQRERGEPCQLARVVKCWLEDPESGFEEEAGEADSCRVKPRGQGCCRAYTAGVVAAVPVNLFPGEANHE